MKPFNIFITICTICILGGFVFFKNQASPQTSSPEQLDQSTINNQQSTINNQQSTINNQQSTINVEREANLDLAKYIEFSPSALASAQQQGHTLLFFAATTWCQTCSELDKEIVARTKEIPATVTILKVDYDNDTQMKRQYAVTAQHTLILLDKEGQEVQRWLGGDFTFLLNKLSESQV